MSSAHAYVSTFAHGRLVQIATVFAAFCATLTLFVAGIGNARAHSEAQRIAQARSYVTSSMLPCTGAVRSQAARSTVKGWPQSLCAGPAQA